MTITNIFDAALCGDLEKVKQYYDGNINCINKFTKLNLLQTVMCGNEKYMERLDIISFLIQEGIEVNSQEGKHKMNALHLLYSSLTLIDEKFILSATKILVGAGIDVNQKDKFGAIPLSYLIAGKLENSKIKPILLFLIEAGAECNKKDNYGNSCVDYAKQFSWRKDIVEMMEDVKDNRYFGGFIVSKNVLSGIPIKYSYREKSSIKELNGWTIMSEKDDDEYACNSNNFVIVTADTLFSISSIMEQIYEAPYGTDLYWKYENDLHIGFYDLVREQDVTIEQILGITTKPSI